MSEAEIVLKNGAVYTVDAEKSWASAVAVLGGRIAYVGDDEGAQAYVGLRTEVIDLEGKMVMPGFFDCHAHASFLVNLVCSAQLSNPAVTADLHSARVSRPRRNR